jgi:hypothetical protein
MQRLSVRARGSQVALLEIAWIEGWANVEDGLLSGLELVDGEVTEAARVEATRSYPRVLPRGSGVMQ